MTHRTPRALDHRVLKRTVDVLVAGAGLLLAGPLVVTLALAVRRTSPGGAIFRQQRIGKDGRPFTIHKLRTMTIGPRPIDSSERAASDAARITPIGRLLRRSSLDELPQLFDVLRGAMSIVGPRPDLPHHVAAYTERQRGRLAMRPGLTGWAQVHGRNELSWQERIDLDLEYVDHWSLRLDALIVARTVGLVLTGRGSGLEASGAER